MDTRRLVLASVFGAAFLLLALPQVANGKGLEPLRIVNLSGGVGWIRGASAKAWWTDYSKPTSASCPCNSPNDVARFAGHALGRVDWKSYSDGSWAPAMLVQAGHTAPMLYYPASRTTPPYLVSPAVFGTNSLSRRWDDWHVVTPRMQRIMTAALKKGTVSTYTGSSAFPTGWAVGGGLGAVLLAGSILLGIWRRPGVLEHLPTLLRPSHYRLSPEFWSRVGAWRKARRLTSGDSL